MGTPGVFKLNIALPNGGEVALECDDRELVRELLYSALPQLSATPGAIPQREAPGPAPAAAEPMPAQHGNGNGQSANNGNGNGSGNGAYAYHNPMPMPPAHPPAAYAAGAAYTPDAYPPAAYPPVANGRETVPGYGHNPAPAPAYHPPPGPFADAAAPALPAPAAPTPESVGNGSGALNGHGNGHSHAYPVNGNGYGNGNGHSHNGHAYNGNGNPPQDLPIQDAAPVPAVEPATLDENDFVAFCHQVSPLGDMRRVVVAAEAADRYLGIASVDPDELTRLFRLAGWSLPHNFVQTLRNAARSKFRWLERIAGQSGHYRVTDTGRSIVLGDAKGAAGMTVPLSAPAPAPASMPAVPSDTPAPAVAGIIAG